MAVTPRLPRKRFAVGSTEDYEEMCNLGSGAAGSVVRARHRATGQVVAIKRFREGEWAPLREARILDSCQGNPFVVGYRGLVRAPGSMKLRLVMECVGPSLRDFLLEVPDDAPPGSEDAVRLVMWQLLTGIKKMHELHIMHRDIKPGNILASDDPNDVTMKICDFGLAMHMSDPPPYKMAGTLWYMAPEMLLGKADYDELVDTWSLGCVMAELITGKVLFPGWISEDQLRCITDVLGVPSHRAWPWFASTPFATSVLPGLPHVQKSNLLRKRFPKTVLSQQGFKVLSGLLTWNPEKRLTASAALKHPWFACLNAPAPARKEELPSALPKRKEQLMDPPNRHKRRKLQDA